MEHISKTFEGKVDEIKSKQEKQKGREHKFLWVRINYSLVRDLHMRRVGAQAFGVFITIRTYMGKDHIAYPSLKTIAYQSKCSIGTVRNAIKILEKEEWVRKVGRDKKEDGKFGNMKYLILQTDLIRGSDRKGFIEEPIANFDNGI
ncbi:MAG: helix-turn-helix domain-containing protein [Candidatus Levybacteria bacterium]|nr:helix-turn-helix domain-containing protein [Candidatus Levybacteria bacterium]